MDFRSSRSPSMDVRAELLNFNRHVALDRVGGDTDLLREVVQLYMDECPVLVGQIEEAVRNLDPQALVRAAHTLKGSLGAIGAEAAAQHAFQLESMGRGQSLDNAGEALNKLQSALSKLHSELAAVTRSA